MFLDYGSSLLMDSISSWMVLCVVLVVTLLMFISTKLQKDPKLVKFAQRLPGPRPLPMIGNAIEFFYKLDGNLSLLKAYEEEYGSTYRFWLGKYLVVVMGDLKDVEVIFSSSKLLSKPLFMDPMQKFYGENLYLAKTSLWKKLRKEIQPAFMRNEFLRKIPLINQSIKKYITQISSRVNGTEFDIGKIFSKLNFDVVVAVILNASFQIEEEDYIFLDKIMDQSVTVFLKRMFMLWLQHPIIDYILNQKRRNRFEQQRQIFFDKIMRNQMRNPMQDSNVMMSTNQSEEKLTYVQSLCKIKEDLQKDDRYVQEEIVTMIAAGTMPATSTVSLCILMLAMHPEVQEKLYEEISHHFNNRDEDADADDFDSLPYLDQVLKETERRFSVISAIIRNVEEDVVIGSHVLPPGTSVFVPSSSIHMNPKYYKNPEKFDPDHFSPDAVLQRPQFAFLPFSRGPRNCIGEALGELEIKLTIIAFIRRFKFSTSSTINDIDLIPGMSLENRNGYKVSVQMRENL